MKFQDPGTFTKQDDSWFMSRFMGFSREAPYWLISWHCEIKYPKIQPNTWGFSMIFLLTKGGDSTFSRSPSLSSFAMAGGTGAPGDPKPSSLTYDGLKDGGR